MANRKSMSLGILGLLLKSPVAFLILVGVVVAVILVGVGILWAMKLLTAVVLGGTFAVVAVALFKTNVLPLQKYPWLTLVLIIMPFLGFFVGMYTERAGILYVTPLLQKPQAISPYYAGQPLSVVASNVEVILLLIIGLSVFIAFAKGGKQS